MSDLLNAAFVIDQIKVMFGRETAEADQFTWPSRIQFYKRTTRKKFLNASRQPCAAAKATNGATGAGRR